MHNDMDNRHWVFRKTHPACHPYLSLARADRPVGTWLLLIPCFWGIALGADGILNMSFRDWWTALLFAAGAVLMRSAGCVINDLWDKDIDAAVERTRQRPLAAGTLSRKQAFVFLGGLLFAALLILLCLRPLELQIGLAAASMVLVVTYPLMKRVTWWPQFVLGLAFNWGGLMGYAAMTGFVGPAAAVLYVAGIFWTLGYDTVYAHQDKEDDAIAGVRSTALLFGRDSKTFVALFMAAAVTLLAAAKMFFAPSFMTPLLLLPVVSHAVWQVLSWKMDEPQSSLKIFRSNRDFGLLALLMISL